MTKFGQSDTELGQQFNPTARIISLARPVSGTFQHSERVPAQAPGLNLCCNVCFRKEPLAETLREQIKKEFLLPAIRMDPMNAQRSLKQGPPESGKPRNLVTGIVDVIGYR